MKIFVTNKKKNESLGADITDFQRWVDYDMKHYKRISDKTMEAIKEAGLSVVKDQYGDYEVIADAKVESVEQNGYTKDQLLDVIKSYKKQIERSGKEYPTVVLDDISKSIDYVLKKNGIDESCKTESCRKTDRKTDRKSVKENRNHDSDDISADEI